VPGARIVIAVLIGACSAPGVPTQTASRSVPASTSTVPSATAIAASPTPPGDPLGVIALGHSGINGHGNPAGVAVSWATGTSPQVNSVYLRLVEALPGFEGHVANTAISGSRASALESQARTALQMVPVPALVVVYTMENDIQCAVDEAPNVASYGQALSSALAFIAGASPGSVILVVSSFGRPARYAALFADRPEIRQFLGGSGPCDMFEFRSGTLVPAKVDRLTGILKQYEAETSRVCATLPQCRTDDGLFTTYVESLEDFVPDDWGHLNARGHAKLAELIWPKVVEILDLE
jgi:hypothetical protein